MTWRRAGGNHGNVTAASKSERKQRAKRVFFALMEGGQRVCGRWGPEGERRSVLSTGLGRGSHDERERLLQVLLVEGGGRVGSGGVRARGVIAGVLDWVCSLACEGKEEDVGLDEFGEGGKGVVSKIREFSRDLSSELFGDKGGE
ncbi:hypothetical protein Tco_1244593 [Tanacetum coccineum]